MALVFDSSAMLARQVGLNGHIMNITHKIFICGLTMSICVSASAQHPDLKYSPYGEVVLDGGNPIIEPAKAISNLVNALQKDKKANRFRITWVYREKDKSGSGSAIYIRDERAFKFQFKETKHLTVSPYAITTRENCLFTKITDDALFKFNKACKSESFVKQYTEEGSNGVVVYDPERPTVFSWLDRFAGGGKYELKERS